MVKYIYGCRDCPLINYWLEMLMAEELRLKVIKGIQKESRFWQDIKGLDKLPKNIIIDIAKKQFLFENRRNMMSDYILKSVAPKHVKKTHDLSLFFGLMIQDAIKYKSPIEDIENDLKIVITDTDLIKALMPIFEKEIPEHITEQEKVEPVVISPACDFDWRIINILHDTYKDERNITKVEMRLSLHKTKGVHEEIVFELSQERFQTLFDEFIKIKKKLEVAE